MPRKAKPRAVEPKIEAAPPEQEVITNPEKDTVRQQPTPQELNGTDQGLESHAAKVRPEGPRKLKPSEPRTVYSAVEAGFKLQQTPNERSFRFSDDLPPSVQEKED